MKGMKKLSKIVLGKNMVSCGLFVKLMCNLKGVREYTIDKLDFEDSVVEGKRMINNLLAGTRIWVLIKDV